MQYDGDAIGENYYTENIFKGAFNDNTYPLKLVVLPTKVLQTTTVDY